MVPLTRVKAVTTEIVDFAPTITLTGVIAAQIRTDLSFRLSGKISERLVNVGDHVVLNQVLARLDPDEQQAELRLGPGRRRLGRGHGAAGGGRLRTPEGAAWAAATPRVATTTRRKPRCARPRRSSTRRTSDLAVAQDQLAYTELRADADGIITARMAEAGQVVAQAQPIYTLARDGPRDAVFNVHEWALANVATDTGLVISLVSDPAVTTLGDLREISPAVNPATQTVTVKIGLRETPHAMTLGALVDGTGPTQAAEGRPRAVGVAVRDRRPAGRVGDRSAKQRRVAEAHHGRPLHQGSHRRGDRPGIGRGRGQRRRADAAAGTEGRDRSGAQAMKAGVTMSLRMHATRRTLPDLRARRSVKAASAELSGEVKCGM